MRSWLQNAGVCKDSQLDADVRLWAGSVARGAAIADVAGLDRHAPTALTSAPRVAVSLPLRANAADPYRDW